MGLLLGVALLFICFLFSGVVVNLIIGMAGYSQFADMISTPGGRLLYRFVQGLSNLLGWGLPALLWAVYVGGFKLHLGLSRPISRWNLALGALVTLAFLPLAAGLIIPQDSFFLPEALKSVETWAQEQEKATTSAIVALIGEPGWGLLLLNIIVIAVVPAIAEELFFRGFLLRALHRIMPTHAAVWVGAAIFSLVHFQFHGFFARMLLGAVLGYLCIFSGDLRASMVAHFVHNFVNLVLVLLSLNGVIGSGIVDDGFNFGFLPTLASSLVALGLLYVYFRRVSAPKPIELNE